MCIIMKKLSSGQKVGLLIQLIIGIIMTILVLIEKPIFDFVAWIFFIGIIITLLSSLLLLKK